jgi:2-hydroxy-3-keto-5-methylthiopentenyl-1-phosphate phosphatase
MSPNGSKLCHARMLTTSISKRMFEEIIFLRFGVLKIVISDGGSHFIDKRFEQYLSRHRIHYNIATPYHP